MPQRITATVRAEDLPRSLVSKLSERPPPGTRFRITAERIDETDDEKLAALRAAVAKGVADADAGRIVDEDDVFAELQARYPDPDA